MLHAITTMKQKPLTTTFIKAVEKLTSTGRINQSEIADKIKMPPTTLTSIMKGRRNVPVQYYDKFIEVYKPVQIDADGDALRLILEIVYRNEAMNTVALSAIGEILAHTKGVSASKINSDLKELVNRQVVKNLEKLK